MAIPVPVAQLIGTFLEALAYGVYIVIFPRCLDILRKRNLRKGLMFYLLATMIISCTLITIHLVVDLIRAFAAFAGNMDIPGSPAKYYANVDTTLNITKNATYVSVTLLADALLVYRTFIIWGGQYWVVILPVLLLGLDVAISVWFTWSLNEASPGSSVLVSTAFVRSKYFYTTTLALNLLCTILIAFKISNTQRQVSGYPGASNCRYTILSTILESAAIYTAILVCLIGTSVSDNSTMFLFLNSIPPVIGSVFSYIVIRSSMDNNTGTPRSSTDFGSASSLGRFRVNHNSMGVNHTMHDRDLGVVVVCVSEQSICHHMGLDNEHRSSRADTGSLV